MRTDTKKLANGKYLKGKKLLCVKTVENIYLLKIYKQCQLFQILKT